MTKSLATIAFVCFALGTAACSPSHWSRGGKKTTTTTVDPDSILADKSLTPKQKSEKLALGAEQLTTPASFMFADNVADLALQQDPTNLRAQLIKALVRPAVLSKGFYWRIQPLAEKTDQMKATYQNKLAEINRWPNIELKKFVLDKSKPQFKTEAEAQAFVSTITAAFDKLRLFFKNHKDMEMTLNLPDMYKNAALAEASHECDVLQEMKDQDTEEAHQPIIKLACDYTEVGEFKIDRAENETMQQIAAGAVIYSTILNSYNLEGAAEYVKEYHSNDPNKLSNKQIFEALIKNPKFGTVRNAQGLKGLPDLGLDFIGGVRWAASMQSSLCRVSSQYPDHNRPGYLLYKGICLDSHDPGPFGLTLDSLMRTGEFALQGGPLNAFIVPQDGTETVYDTQFKPAALLTNPISDVRSLGAITWDKDGARVAGSGDKTFGGVFPKGDANTVFGLNGDLKIRAK